MCHVDYLLVRGTIDIIIMRKSATKQYADYIIKEDKISTIVN